MKKLILVAAFGIVGNSFAGPWTIKVNSFARLIPNYYMAELCGNVTGPADEFKDAKVEILVDPNTNNPGMYVTSVDRVGNFCHIVNAISGQARVTLWVPGQTVVSTDAHLDHNSRTK